MEIAKLNHLFIPRINYKIDTKRVYDRVAILGGLMALTTIGLIHGGFDLLQQTALSNNLSLAGLETLATDDAQAVLKVSVYVFTLMETMGRLLEYQKNLETTALDINS